MEDFISEFNYYIKTNRMADLDKNPYLDTEYFVSRTWKQRVKKLTSKTHEVLNNANKICKPNIVTMTNNCRAI